MPEDYTPQREGIESPPVRGVILTPAANGALPWITRGFCLFEESPLDVTWEDGNRVTIPTGFYAAGITHPARFKRIWAAGTTTTTILIVR